MSAGSARTGPGTLELPTLFERWGNNGLRGRLANFSRLVCDPNRDVEDEFFIRTELEGRPLSLIKR